MIRTLITAFELALVEKVARARLQPASSHKRFILGLNEKSKLGERGRWYLAWIAHRYRRQYNLSEEQLSWINERLSGEIPSLDWL